MSSKGNAIFALKLPCDLRLSRETPKTSAPALRNFAWLAAKSAPSVVQPGVLSFG